MIYEGIVIFNESNPPSIVTVSKYGRTLTGVEQTRNTHIYYLGIQVLGIRTAVVRNYHILMIVVCESVSMKK